jgi:putative NADH-flavin reductase
MALRARRRIEQGFRRSGHGGTGRGSVRTRIIASSGLDWVIVRPAVLTNGPQRNVYHAGPDVGNWCVPSRISRSDVATFMLEQLTGGDYLRMTPGVAD